MLLGFHKCGTTDIEQWFHLHKQVVSSNADYFYDKNTSASCPFEWIERHQHQKRLLYNDPRLTSYDSCPGCIGIYWVKEESAFITLQSTVQYLQYTLTAFSRYVITMRKPSSRMISHFFYTLQQGDHSASFNTIGGSLLHKIVSESLLSLTSCLKEYGTTVCVLVPGLSPIKNPYSYVTEMVTQSCYSTHLTEVLKFIPRELIYFSRLEDYSKEEVKVMKEILSFVGLSESGLRNVNQLKKSAKNAIKFPKPVLKETDQMLDDFYRPFNKELADLLSDDRWLWLY
ncbi:carbohydrate sulfotransferase 15-like [Watersipora subatra]|uniref:carbohydrate sulfotransferase 15-like n=1 Tax=Watersipora subatra TaxID=2589382 RepID=UPI00355C0E9D